jgi:hypothetical protein
VEGVTVKELREGSLKAVLALFFALSKHKQQQKLHKPKLDDNMQSR